MTILATIQRIIGATHRRTIGAALDALAERRARRDEAAFSMALIALSAKMAKADGVVTDDEIEAFREFFQFPDEEASKVRMVYNLAQQDVAGYEQYLGQVARIYADAPMVLEDVLDCLYYIAAADGVAHPHEMALLDKAAEVFGVSTAAVRRIKSAHLGLGDDDPYVILNLEPAVSDDALKAAYRRLVKEHHPDAIIARGVPASLVRIAEKRLAAINTAYEAILRERAASGA
ncbi:MAG: molecular chaperone DjiA [Pseudomonadota bacterium]